MMAGRPLLTSKVPGADEVASSVGAAARVYPSGLSTGGWYVFAENWPVERHPLFAPPPTHLVPVLEQLLGGANDAVASSNLGMSPRTFSRRVAELLDYLGAATRFQGGAEAVLRGWVPSLWTNTDDASPGG